MTVDAFATCRVAPGWRLRLPALDWATFHYVLRGEGKVGDEDGRAAELLIGALAVVPPRLLHSLVSGPPPYGEATPSGGAPTPSGMADHRAGPIDEQAFTVVCGRVEVSYGGSLGLFDQLDGVLVLDFSRDPVMRATFEAMLQEVRDGRPGARAMTSTLMKACLIRVFREVCTQDDCKVGWLRALEDPTLAPVLDVMLAHPEEPHSVASLAARAYMSRSVFARRFRETFGQPPLVYLRGIRLRRAAELLRKLPPLPITTVARQSGFASRSQF